VRAVGARVYGNPNVCDPAFEYDPPETKAIPAIWHHNRGMIVDSLVLCDYENTRVFSMLSQDGAADRLDLLHGGPDSGRMPYGDPLFAGPIGLPVNQTVPSDPLVQPCCYRDQLWGYLAGIATEIRVAWY